MWWEAEAPKSGNFPTDNPFAPARASAAAQVLSGGAWVGATDPGKILFLEYEISAPRSATYQFFARKFWRHGPFRWRFDDRPWQSCGKDVGLLDEATLAPFVVANWVRLGSVPLSAGRHTVRIELSSATGSSAFDCFLLTPDVFTPRGKLKPGEHYPPTPPGSDEKRARADPDEQRKQEEGWFVFDPDRDRFNADAALDLRGMNEKSAGAGGFIVARGASFVHQGTGEPIRFWGVNAGPDLLDHDRDDIAHFARHLSKLGVNLVRFHGPLWRADDVTRVDPATLAKLHRLSAALKREGVYLGLSTYYPVWLRPKSGIPGLEGYAGDKETFASAFFNPRLQDLQRGWWKDALTVKNPETGLPLVADPSLAFIEIQNEDSLFFWTFAPYDNVPAAQMEIAERRFGAWLGRKYGNIPQAFATWGAGDRVRGDDVAAGRAGFLPLWQLLDRRREPRARDTARFMAELERDYYDGMRVYLKSTLAFRGSVTGSNWMTADDAVLGPLDKWANAGGDFMDRHGYYAGPHEGDRASYSLSAGDRYRDVSALRFQTGKGEAAEPSPAGAKGRHESGSEEPGVGPPIALPFMISPTMASRPPSARSTGRCRIAIAPTWSCCAPLMAPCRGPTPSCSSRPRTSSGRARCRNSRLPIRWSWDSFRAPRSSIGAGG